MNAQKTALWSVDVLTSQLSGDQAQAWQETLQSLHTAYNLGQNC